MQLLGWFFRVSRIGPTFMTSFYTTIGSTVYVPDIAFTTNPVNLLETIMHECLHAADNKKWLGIFPFTYLFPQVLGVLALLALLAPLLGTMWLLWLLALVCLAPIPAPGRYHWELRAYRTSVLIGRKVNLLSDEQMNTIYDWVGDNLSTRFYYFAWPWKQSIVKDLKDERFMSEPEYQRMLEFLKKEQLVPVS